MAERSTQAKAPLPRQRPGSGSASWLPWAIGAGIVLFVAVLMAVLLFSPVLATKNFTVAGLQLGNDDEVQRKLDPLRNKPLPQITQDEVSNLLSGIPQVKSVSVEARPPESMLVRVVERIPVAVLKEGDQFILVDPQGIRLGTAPDQATAQLPLIDGGSSVIGSDSFVAITKVLAALPPDIRSQMKSASAKTQDSVSLSLNDGREVVWGDASDMGFKARVLKALLDSGKTAQVYDVSSPNYPVLR